MEGRSEPQSLTPDPLDPVDPVDPLDPLDPRDPGESADGIMFSRFRHEKQ